ncbi:MAG: hypothetical protein HDR43_00880 [Mycoplasma sp.]|nr:hypothetical protein [Mycoplasma sp.]
MNNWATWLIFGLLLVALIGFLLFTFFNDRRKNNKLIQKRIELKRATVKTSKELAIRIYTLIEMNDEYLKEVQPGLSKIKMKNVNSVCRSFLKEIYDSKSFKVLYIDSDDADPKYSQSLKKLIDTKSNLWNKYCEDEIIYFKKFHDELKSDPNFETIKDDSKNEIDKFLKDELRISDESTK